MRTGLLFVVTSTLIVCATPGCSAQKTNEGLSQLITLTTDDGVRIAATYRPVASSPSPGIILLHMLGTDRHRWDAFAGKLRQDGYASIAIDMRGHGESTRRQNETLNYKNFSTSDWMAVVRDIDAAKRALIDRGAQSDNIAIIGASIGANLALQYAVSHSDIPAIVLVSPGLDYHGVETAKAIVDYGKRPSLLMTSEGDSYSASTCQQLKSAAVGNCELRQYPGSAHGNDLLDASQAAAGQILVWLKEVMHPKAAPASR